jgi:hypothetical protein
MVLEGLRRSKKTPLKRIPNYLFKRIQNYLPILRATGYSRMWRTGNITVAKCVFSHRCCCEHYPLDLLTYTIPRGFMGLEEE